MILRWLQCIGLLGCCALYGCGSSPPTRFYILDQIAPSAAAAASEGANNIAVRVEPPVLPPEIDRPELVTRSGPNRVHVAGSQRWAAPLRGQIRRVFSDDLAARLPPGLVADPDEPATNEPRRALTIAIEEFYGDDSCAVSLRVGWSLAKPRVNVLHGSEQVQIPGNAPCSGELAAAMSRALAVLADRLAQVIAAN
jgi:uncharacterized lipoprotein YmbA